MITAPEVKKEYEFLRNAKEALTTLASCDLAI
jgi:hypothetical protein